MAVRRWHTARLLQHTTTLVVAWRQALPYLHASCRLQRPYLPPSRTIVRRGNRYGEASCHPRHGANRRTCARRTAWKLLLRKAFGNRGNRRGRRMDADNRTGPFQFPPLHGIRQRQQHLHRASTFALSFQLKAFSSAKRPTACGGAASCSWPCPDPAVIHRFPNSSPSPSQATSATACHRHIRGCDSLYTPYQGSSATESA